MAVQDDRMAIAPSSVVRRIRRVEMPSTPKW
jgi:hypothetical protein